VQAEKDEAERITNLRKNQEMQYIIEEQEQKK